MEVFAQGFGLLLSVYPSEALFHRIGSKGHTAKNASVSMLVEAGYSRFRVPVFLSTHDSDIIDFSSCANTV
jgi:hypothetical protein